MGHKSNICMGVVTIILFVLLKMNYSYYKYCVVPMCKSTTLKTPNKLFIYVPNNEQIRKKWLKLARCDNVHSFSTISRMYFCEDHFDLPNDMVNYMEYHIMGTVSQMRMIPGCTPSKFECQEDRRKRTCSSIERPYIVKKQRMTIITECLKESEKGCTSLKDISDTSSSRVHNLRKENETIPYNSGPRMYRDENEPKKIEISPFNCSGCRRLYAEAQFACVNCQKYELCVRCATDDPKHADHYLLRARRHSTQDETRIVLEAVRAQLKSFFTIAESEDTIQEDEYAIKVEEDTLKEYEDKVKEDDDTIRRDDDTIRRNDDTLGLHEDENEVEVEVPVNVKEEPLEEDPLSHCQQPVFPALDLRIEYPDPLQDVSQDVAGNDVMRGQGDSCSGDDEPKSKKRRSTTAVKLETEEHSMSEMLTVVAYSKKFTLKFKRKIVFAMWCKESGPMKQRRINLLRTLHNWLPKSTPVDITMLETCVNSLCEKFETYKRLQFHGDSSSILNKYSEWFDVEEVVMVSKVRP